VRFNGEDLGQALSASNPNGSNLREIVPFSADVAVKHDWSPSGNRLVFTDHADDPTLSANMATIRPDRTRLHYLTHFTDPALRAYPGGYSPDGKWIVFRLEDHGRYGLYRIRPDGSGLAPILGLSSFRPRFIDWGSHS